jgi:hypothetical protein
MLAGGGVALLCTLLFLHICSIKAKTLAGEWVEANALAGPSPPQFILINGAVFRAQAASAMDENMFPMEDSLMPLPTLQR